jgi:peptidoglycan/LPS O-acetylase OafA/YrhL
VLLVRYRAEIDGLRAIAVVPVILFHAGFAPFAGGYVGVDAFFVISGYLITSLLIEDLEHGRFSLAQFYERRARRILPALFFMMLCCLPFAWAWMVPSELKNFAQALVAVSLFASNILFWRNTDYFAPSAEENPLLHTWSLAVEEQFYIFFPLLLMALWRFGRRRVLAIVLLLSLASLAVAEWGWRRYPEATFYLIVTRAWELGAGAICAFLLRGRPVARGHALLSGLGLGLIVASVVVYDSATPFPSLYALAPVGGTMLIVLFAGPDTPVGRLLSLRVFRGIGLISYSAYLWHQPLFAFARIRSIDHPDPWVMLGLAALSLGLGWLSWRFVEQPFRRGPRPALPSRTAVFAASAAAMSAFISLGAFGHLSNGFREVWMLANPAHAKVYAMLAAAEGERPTLPTDGACRFESGTLDDAVVRRLADCHALHGPGIAVIGDSHARDFYRGYFQTANTPFLFGLVEGGCRPHETRAACDLAGFVDLVSGKTELFASVYYTQAGFHLLETVQGERGRSIIRNVSLTEPMDPSRYRAIADHVAAVLDYLGALGRVADVTWIGPRIEPHIPRQWLLLRGCGGRFDLRTGQRRTFETLDRAVATAASQAQVHYVSQIEAVAFDMARDFMSCDALYWSDGDHWTSVGAEVFVGRLLASGALRLSSASIAAP